MAPRRAWCAFALVIVVACSDEPDPILDAGANVADATGSIDAATEADSGTDAGDPFTCRDDIDPVEGGGIGGGPLAGRVTVFVHSVASGEALAGTSVIAQFDGNTME